MVDDRDRETNRRWQIVLAVRAGATGAEIAKRFHVAFTTGRMYVYKARSGIWDNAGLPRKPRAKSRRTLSGELFAQGYSVRQVADKLGLAVTTASGYRWEFQQLALKRKRDPLLD